MNGNYELSITDI